MLCDKFLLVTWKVCDCAHLNQLGDSHRSEFYGINRLVYTQKGEIIFILTTLSDPGDGVKYSNKRAKLG